MRPGRPGLFVARWLAGVRDMWGRRFGGALLLVGAGNSAEILNCGGGLGLQRFRPGELSGNVNGCWSLV